MAVLHGNSNGSLMLKLLQNLVPIGPKLPWTPSLQCIDFKNMKLKHFWCTICLKRGQSCEVFCLSHNRVIFTFYSWRRNKMNIMWFPEHAASRAMHNLISRSAILIYKGWQMSRRNPNVCTWREFPSPLLRKMLFVETVTHNVLRIAAFDVYLYWNEAFKISSLKSKYMKLNIMFHHN